MYIFIIRLVFMTNIVTYFSQDHYFLHNPKYTHVISLTCRDKNLCVLLNTKGTRARFNSPDLEVAYEFWNMIEEVYTFAILRCYFDLHREVKYSFPIEIRQSAIGAPEFYHVHVI